MFWFGAVCLTETLNETFEGKVRPITDQYSDEKYELSGVTRSEALTWPKSEIVLPKFAEWVLDHKRPGTEARIYSDCNGYDAMWLNMYLHRFADCTVFGHSSVNIKNLYQGLVSGIRSTGAVVPDTLGRSFKDLRKTEHNHNPVTDAIGNAEALLAMKAHGLEVSVQT